MSEVQQQPQEQPIKNIGPEVNIIDEILSDDSWNMPKEAKESQNADVEQSSETQKSEQNIKTNDQKEDSKHPEEKKSDSERTNRELERVKGDLSETRRWGRINAQKLKQVEKAIQSLSESGSLTESEAQELLSIAKNEKHSIEDDEDEDNSRSNKKESNPISELISIADSKIQELADIFDDDKDFYKKTDAFGKFIQFASPKELEDIMDELEPLKSSPIKLAKRMYRIGEEFYESFYKDLENAGGLKDLVIKQKKEIENLKKKVDKVNEKNLKSQDYDKPNYKLAELNEAPFSENQSIEGVSIIDLAIDERDRKRHR